MTVKLTSGGIDRGALPICDCVEVVAEKALAEDWKAGTRKAGIDMDGLELIALKAAPRLVESMATAVLWRQLLLLLSSRYSMGMLLRSSMDGASAKIEHVTSRFPRHRRRVSPNGWNSAIEK